MLRGMVGKEQTEDLMSPASSWLFIKTKGNLHLAHGIEGLRYEAERLTGPD